MADDIANLEHGQEQVIIALVNEPTIRKAAEVSGVGERTIYTWLEQPAFMAAYRKARREAFSQAMGLVHKYAPLAVQTLAQMVADKGTPASSRVSLGHPAPLQPRVAGTGRPAGTGRGRRAGHAGEQAVRLLFRIAKLEERHGGCGWCGQRMIWYVDELTVVDGVAKPICPECGKDHTGYAKVVLRELMEAI